MRVQAGAGGGAAEGNLCHARQSALDAAAGEADLRGVAGELLAERDGDGIHQMRTTGLDDAMEGLGLCG